MGVPTRVEKRDGREVHVTTGKWVPSESPAGVEHEPEWSEWRPEHGMQMRMCLHPDCEIDEYRR